MMEALIGVIGSGLLGITAWGFNLQSRVAVLEADKSEASKREASLKELIDVKLEAITERLMRIERKLDKEQ